MNWVINGSGNGLSLVPRQAINLANVDLLSIGPIGTNFNEILIAILLFPLKNSFENVICQIGGHFVHGEMR